MLLVANCIGYAPNLESTPAYAEVPVPKVPRDSPQTRAMSTPYKIGQPRFLSEDEIVTLHRATIDGFGGTPANQLKFAPFLSALAN